MQDTTFNMSEQDSYPMQLTLVKEGRSYI